MTEPKRNPMSWPYVREALTIAAVLVSVGITLGQIRATAAVVHDLQVNQREMELWRAEHVASQEAAAKAEDLRIREQVRRELRDEGLVR